MSGLPRDLIYVGLKGTVAALDRATGTERWRAKLKGTQFVGLISDGDRIYATTMGEAFCLDPVTGTVLWRNPLPRLGLGVASLLGSGGERSVQAGLAAEAAQRRAAAAGAAAS